MAHLKGHDKYRCKLCKKDFSSKKKLKNHKNTEHDPSSATTSQQKTQKPINNNNKATPAGKNENFTCIVCLQSYKSEALFKGHDCSKETKAKEKKANAKDVTMKLGPGRFKCKLCDFEHRKCSAVVRHARMHRNKKRFVCELCGSAFNAHYTLKEHRAYVHSNDRKYSCGKCGKTFKAKNALIRHEQVHSETRPHKCQICGQEYKRHSHLQRHLMTSHQGAEKDTARYWEDTAQNDGESRYRPPGGQESWSEGRDPGPRTTAAISASAALAVVTTLDLNMRNEGKAGKEVKEERGVVPAGSYNPRPDPSEATYSLPDVRSDVSVYQATSDARGTEAGQAGFTGSDTRAEAYSNVQGREDTGYADVEARETGYPNTQGRSDAGYPSTEGRGDVQYLTAEEKSYYRGSYPPLKTSYPGERYGDRGGSGGGYPLEERYYSSESGQERGYHQRQGQERGYPDQRYREAQPYLDSVPADLTMASSSTRLSGTVHHDQSVIVINICISRDGREEVAYPRGTRQRYSNYLQQQRQTNTYYPSRPNVQVEYHPFTFWKKDEETEAFSCRRQGEMSEAEHLGEREHLKASKIRPTGASRTSATRAGKPFAFCSLFHVLHVQAAS